MKLIRTPQTARRRTGFTLVELLVATALTMLIMAIISSAFQTALDSLSHLRSAGELQDRLRSAGEKLRQDLQAPHFDDEAIKGGKLSEVKSEQNPNFRPLSGFFHVEQATESVAEHTGVQTNPRDYSTKAVNHGMMFTVQLPGNSRQSLFTAPRIASIPGKPGLDSRNDNLVSNATQTYGSRWAIVSYFLTPMAGQLTTGSNLANNQQLYHLHRRVKLLAEIPDTFVVPGSPGSENYFYDDRQTLRNLVTAPNTYGPTYANPNYGRVYTAKDRAVWDANAKFDLTVIDAASTIPTNMRSAWGRPTDMFTPIGDGSDIVMSNMLSLEVKADFTDVVSPLVKTSPVTPIVSQFPRRSVRTSDLSTPPFSAIGVTVDHYNANNKDYPFDDLPPAPVAGVKQADPRSFDTGAGGGTLPMTSTVTTTTLLPPAQPYRVKAIQIKLRIYDPKNKSTRQTTIVQEM